MDLEDTGHKCRDWKYRDQELVLAIFFKKLKML